MAKKLVCNNVTTIAIRYQFVLTYSASGVPRLNYLPHEVIKCEADVPSENVVDDAKNDAVVIEDVDVTYLRSLDPKEWKTQDHYKVIGLGKSRYKASEEHIKTAYRKMVLKHHPDKREAQGEEIRKDDDYFTCITMAYEILGNPIKRRSYDSVDPEFDNSLPTSNELKKDFFKVCKYYFDLNSRWCESKKVPKLGTPSSKREDVEHFYTFWYNFKSWREFSYEDEEDKDKCQDRDERKYVDKINKAERLRRKKEEMSRVRQFVDLAYNADPRIMKFKQDDKERKSAAKKAKQTAAQRKKDEEEKILREAQLLKEKAEAEERAKMELRRQERETQKKAHKKQKKIFRLTCKSYNYFSSNIEDNLKYMTAVDRICETLELSELEELNKNLQDGRRDVFLQAMEKSDGIIENERKSGLVTYTQKVAEQIKNNNTKSYDDWSQENLQLLIKAVNLFPAGTNQRWEVVANFINQHGSFPDSSKRFSAKVVLAKAKDLQSTDFSKNNLKEAANKRAFDSFRKDKQNVLLVDEKDISKRLDQNTLKINNKKAQSNDTGRNADGFSMIKSDKPWTAEEQQLLEQALKTYSSSTPERWDRIAECVPNRSKKDCMKRYKELVEIVKAKKAAQDSIPK